MEFGLASAFFRSRQNELYNRILFCILAKSIVDPQILPMSQLSINYRKAQKEDLDYLLQLRMATMQSYLQHAGFHLSQEEHLQRVLYQFEGAQMILLKEKPIGLLKLSSQAEAIEIIQIQIDPDQQGKGIGRMVVEGVLRKAALEEKMVKLSVLKGNPAIGLYEKLGFSEVGETEDSVLMEVKII